MSAGQRVACVHHCCTCVSGSKKILEPWIKVLQSNTKECAVIELIINLLALDAAALPTITGHISPTWLQTHIGDQNYAETWSVQLFRSIDSSSAAGLPRTQAALKMGLSTQKGKVVDFSIQVYPPPPLHPLSPFSILATPLSLSSNYYIIQLLNHPNII